MTRKSVQGHAAFRYQWKRNGLTHRPKTWKGMGFMGQRTYLEKCD